MNGMLWTFGLLLAAAAALVPMIERDVKRAVARREQRRRFEAIARNIEAMKRNIGERLMPSMLEMATAARKATLAFERMGAQWVADEKSRRRRNR